MMSADEARERDLGCMRGLIITLLITLIIGVLFGLPILLGWIVW